MAKLNENGTKALAFTSQNEEEEKLWPRVDDGEFRVVYITPEALTDIDGHFHRVTMRRRLEFKQNLVAVAIDECEMIWDWEGFREKWNFIEDFWRRLNLRLDFPRIPFACISASLTPPIKRDSKVLRPTINATVNPRLDNINIVVSQIKGPGIQELLSLIPEGTRDPLQIPKTIIFHDNIDRGIRIAHRLRARLPDEVAGIPSKSIVPCFFGTMDLKARMKALSEFRKGRARIMLCMDAWGLLIDVPDIERVIQWQVDERLDFSDLHQRIRKAANNGVAIIYVEKSILDSISRTWKEDVVNWEQAWQRSDLFFEEYDSDDVMEYDEDEQVKREWKKRRLGRFGLPVRPDTKDKVSLHIKHLYREARTIRKARGAAQQERRRTSSYHMPSTKNLDPAVLWLLCTQGCRHGPFEAILKDPK